MEERPPISSEQMSQEDWERMPASGKQLVEDLLKRVMQLEAEIGHLRAENQLWSEQIKRTSANSSQPPSQDPPQAFKPSPKRKSGKKRGGQPGHEGHERRLYPTFAVRQRDGLLSPELLALWCSVDGGRCQPLSPSSGRYSPD